MNKDVKYLEDLQIRTAQRPERSVDRGEHCCGGVLRNRGDALTRCWRSLLVFRRDVVTLLSNVVGSDSSCSFVCNHEIVPVRSCATQYQTTTIAESSLEIFP